MYQQKKNTHFILCFVHIYISHFYLHVLSTVFLFHNKHTLVFQNYKNIICVLICEINVCKKLTLATVHMYIYIIVLSTTTRRTSRKYKYPVSFLFDLFI